uniref:BTB domain-containing protein n=1 Tax=Panagrolaimus davidi TaxID=227884 RepID=A0A914QMH2_9BILA
MYKKFDFVRRTTLSTGTTLIKFGENVELTAVYVGNRYNSFKIDNPKLDFEIKKIIDDEERDITYRYDKSKKTFVPYLSSNSFEYTFYISAIIQLKPVPSDIYHYKLRIPADEFKNLKLDNLIKAEIVLTDHDNSKFTYYVTKIAPSTIELFIENPYDVEIQGKKGNFKAEYESKKDINVELSFVFGQSYLIMKKIATPSRIKISKNEKTKELQPNEQFHNAIDGSPPQSRLGSPIPFELPNEPKLSNDIFPDAFLIASDKTEIPCHRCILAKFSGVFVELFNAISNHPVKINAEDFDAKTIQSALGFLYGKTDSIKGKENEVLKFALKYNIKMLKDSCIQKISKNSNKNA